MDSDDPDFEAFQSNLRAVTGKCNDESRKNMVQILPVAVCSMGPQ